MEEEAKTLADAPFGERLLKSIAWAYTNAAHRYPASVSGVPYSVSQVVTAYCVAVNDVLFCSEAAFRAGLSVDGPLCAASTTACNYHHYTHSYQTRHTMNSSWRVRKEHYGTWDITWG